MWRMADFLFINIKTWEPRIKEEERWSCKDYTLSKPHYFRWECNWWQNKGHVWQSTTCSVCFWATHCSYSTWSIFAGGYGNRKLPHPHKHTGPVHLTLSLTHAQKPTLPRKSHSCSKEVGETKGNRSSVRTACGKLLASRFFRHFSPALRKHGGPVPIVYTAGSMERIA